MAGGRWQVVWCGDPCGVSWGVTSVVAGPWPGAAGDATHCASECCSPILL